MAIGGGEIKEVKEFVDKKVKEMNPKSDLLDSLTTEHSAKEKGQGR